MIDTAAVCAEFRKRYNGFADQSDEYIAKHFDVQLALLKETLEAKAEVIRIKQMVNESCCDGQCALNGGITS